MFKFYIIFGILLILNSELSLCDDSDSEGFDEEDLEIFCNKKGRSLSSDKFHVASLLSRDSLPPNLGSDAGSAKRKKIVEKIMLGCPAKKQGAPKNDMDGEFMRLQHEIVKALLAQKTKEDMALLAEEFKADPRVNFNLFWYSTMQAIHNRKDFQGYKPPSAAEFFPEMFLPLGSKKNSEKLLATEKTKCFLVDEMAGIKNGDENLLFYFRENMDLSSHHVYWHLVHSITNVRRCTEDDIETYQCHEDRRGELFAYMHRIVLGMYHSARLSVCLPELREFKWEVGAVIDEPYYPPIILKPTSKNASNWGDRPPFQQLPDEILLHYTQNGECKTLHVKIKPHLKRSYNVLKAIGDGVYLNAANESLPLNSDVLGDMLEASDITPSKALYGSVHNMGHLMMMFAVPDRTKPGCMGDTATAMRDPVFYRWHYFINNIVDIHLRSLPPHELEEGEYPLVWKGIQVEKMELQEVHDYSPANELNTFYRKQQLQLVDSDVGKRICYKTMDHRDFTYKIWVNNKYPAKVRGTVRIFIAPKYAADGKTRMSMIQQRKYIYPLDIYNVDIPPGQSMLPLRFSVNSTITTARSRGGDVDPDNSVLNCKDHKCGCGFPHSLLVPRGKEEGMEFDVVAMITDGEKYKWTYSKEDESLAKCKMAPVPCGLPGMAGRKYPDVDLPMGYPFDRLPMRVPHGAEGYAQYYVRTLDEYAESIENMGMTKIKITHHNLYVKHQDWNNKKKTMSAATEQEPTLCSASSPAQEGDQ